MKRKARRHVPLYKLKTVSVASLEPGASAKGIAAFVAAADRNAPAAYLRKRIELIERHARRFARSRRPDLRALAQGCMDRVLEARYFLNMNMPAVTGDGIATAMAAALSLGDHFQSLIVAAELGPVVAAKLSMTDTGTKNVQDRNQRVKEAADAAAIKMFHDWRRKHSGQLAGLDTASCLKRFLITMHPPRHLKDRLRRLFRDKK
jgi:hypothetical protein